MFDHILVEIWRVGNVALGVVALTLLWLKSRPKTEEMPRRIQVMFRALMLLVATAAYGSAEQVVQEAPLGARVPLVTVALIWILYAMAFLDDED